MLPHCYLGKLWLILGEFTFWYAPMTSSVPTMNHYCGSWLVSCITLFFITWQWHLFPSFCIFFLLLKLLPNPVFSQLYFFLISCQLPAPTLENLGTSLNNHIWYHDKNLHRLSEILYNFSQGSFFLNLTAGIQSCALTLFTWIIFIRPQNPQLSKQ